MRRALSFLSALGGTWLWYGALRLIRQLADPPLSGLSATYAGLGAVLPLPTSIWLELDNARVPLIAAILVTAVLIVVERKSESPANRDLVHTLCLTLLLSYLALSAIAILLAFGNVIGRLS